MKKFSKIIILLFLSIVVVNPSAESSNIKIKIGLLVPMTGENKDIGDQIIKATRMALKDIGYENIEIYPKDTNSNPSQTIKSANELKEMGIKIVIGPVFYKSLVYLDGTELDFVKEGINEGFKFINPNVKGECGCGESFQV